MGHHHHHHHHGHHHHGHFHHGHHHHHVHPIFIEPVQSVPYPVPVPVVNQVAVPVPVPVVNQVAVKTFHVYQKYRKLFHRIAEIIAVLTHGTLSKNFIFKFSKLLLFLDSKYDKKIMISIMKYYIKIIIILK